MANWDSLLPSLLQFQLLCLHEFLLSWRQLIYLGEQLWFSLKTLCGGASTSIVVGETSQIRKCGRISIFDVLALYVQVYSWSDPIRKKKKGVCLVVGFTHWAVDPNQSESRPLLTFKLDTSTLPSNFWSSLTFKSHQSIIPAPMMARQEFWMINTLQATAN